MIKHSGHLGTLEKCRKHEPQASVFFISLVFSNVRRVLSQRNTRLRLLYLLNIGLHSNHITRRLKSFVCTLLLMSKLFFKIPGTSNPSFYSRTFSTDHNYPRSFIKLVAGTVNDFYIGKTKRRLQNRKTEHFKGLSKSDHSSAISDHVETTGHNIKWDHFNILASSKTDYHCKVKETLFIQELQPPLNGKVSSEKLFLY